MKMLASRDFSKPAPRPRHLTVARPGCAAVCLFALVDISTLYGREYLDADCAGAFDDLRLLGIAFIAALRLQIGIDTALGHKLEAGIDVGRAGQATGSFEQEQFQYWIEALQI